MGDSVEKTSARQGLSLFVIFHKADILSHTTIFSSVKHNPIHMDLLSRVSAGHKFKGYINNSLYMLSFYIINMSEVETCSILF